MQNTTNPAPEKSTPAPKPTVGRPPLYTSEYLHLLCGFIQQLGCSDSAAARLAGLSVATISRWKRDHEEVALSLLQAREKFRATHLHNVMSATTRDGRPDWRASAWLLVHVFPEDYGSVRARQQLAEAEAQTEAAAAEVETEVETEAESGESLTDAHPGEDHASPTHSSIPASPAPPHHAAPFQNPPASALHNLQNPSAGAASRPASRPLACRITPAAPTNATIR